MTATSPPTARARRVLPSTLAAILPGIALLPPGPAVRARPATQEAPPAREAAADTLPSLSPEAAAYLAEALAIVRDHAYWSDSVEWTDLRRAAFDTAAGSRVPSDTYEAIRFVLASLGDRHSFLQLSADLRAREIERLRARGLLDEDAGGGASGFLPSPFSDRREPAGSLETRGGRTLASVVIPRTGGLPLQEFADRVHALVREQDAARPCGWIVDLRGNGGGNMWPMLAGIGPVLGESGELGSFLGREGVFGRWYYADGEAGVQGVGAGEGFVGATVSGEPYELQGTPPVAVLVDGGTGSSGEAVAIAFRGRPETRLFGLPTGGVSTVNDGFRLPDDANLVITIGLDADRTGRPYPREVRPDEIVERADTGPDAQFERALGWLLGRPDCAGAHGLRPERRMP